MATGRRQIKISWAILLLILVSVIFLAFHVVTLGKTWGPAFSGKIAIINSLGESVGGDFPLFYSASSLALAGEPASVYDLTRLKAKEKEIFGQDENYIWPYPPSFLLMVLPLSLVPYLAALVIWFVITLLGFLTVVYRLAPNPLTLLLTLAFPGTFFNTLNTHNGFFSAALFGGGLLLLARSPWIGGLLLGFMSYKPHLAVLIPVALIAARQWRALAGAAIGALGLALASALVLGPEVWGAFFKHLTSAVDLLERGGTTWLEKMPTVFAAARLAGWGVTWAWGLQALMMIGIGVAVTYAWYSRASLPVRNSLLILGTLLFTAYAFVYDLVLLALPLAWLGWEGQNKGWLPGEQPALVLGWFMPMVLSFFRGAEFKVPVAPLVLVALFLLFARRQYVERAGSSRSLQD